MAYNSEPNWSLTELVDAHLKITFGIETRSLASLDAKSTEQVLKETCNHCNVGIEIAPQYYLLNAAIMALGNSLSWRNILLFQSGGGCCSPTSHSIDDT